MPTCISKLLDYRPQWNDAPMSIPKTSFSGSGWLINHLRFFSKALKLSSSSCIMAGGILLASNTSISGYGFLGLALSSSQLLIASLLERNHTMAFYTASLFFFVDCLGVYRWLLT
ncbi:hypothetical protein [Nostoc sp.]|uniref:hypothetical protein n=1 Tax=Nostoc sp. TaxID=1180 RepID=UPI002FFAA26C